MDRVEIDGKLRGAQGYRAEEYLAQAVQLLYAKKKIKIEIQETEWCVNKINGGRFLRVNFTADEHYVIINILETIFKDYHRGYDETIGIKTTMPMKTKIILRLAYLLYTHRND